MSFLIIVLLYLTSVCLSAPTTKDSKEPWWNFPCNPQQNNRQLRHAESPLDIALQVANYYNKNNVTSYLLKLPDVPDYKKPWLPKKRKRNNKFILYMDLCIYAAAVQKLIDMKFDNQDGQFNVQSRLSILEGIKVNLKLLLCELKTENPKTMERQKIKASKEKKTKSYGCDKGIICESINESIINIPKEVNNTSQVYTHDKVVLCSYEEYLCVNQRKRKKNKCKYCYTKKPNAGKRDGNTAKNKKKREKPEGNKLKKKRISKS